jgi:regulator of RNase E activity RraA
MRTVPADGRSSAQHLGARALDRALPGEVIVVEQQAEGVPASASWGGLLARAASLRALGGVVVDGACRDIDEIRELGLPVSAREVVPFTARGRFAEDSVGESVQLRGMRVCTGDFVMADGTGVVVIPADRIDEVLEVAERLAAKEAAMAAALGDGDTLAAVFGRNYEEMLNAR